VTDRDRIIAYENLLDDQSYDTLAFAYAEGFSSIAQSGKKRCEGLGQAQECGTVSGLIGDGL
jgi:hypothetical protein